MQIAGQMGISAGIYTAQTLTSGRDLTPGGYAFALIGGYAAGIGLPQNTAFTVTALLGLQSTISAIGNHFGVWITRYF